MNAKIQTFSRDDEEEYLELHNKIFDSGMDREMLQWKYVQPIIEGDSTPRLITAKVDGKLVGSIGEIKIPMEVNDFRVIGRNPADVMIAEPYRGADLFIKLVDALREINGGNDVALEFGTGEPETRKVWKAFGKWSYTQLCRDVIIYNPFRLLNQSNDISSGTIEVVSILEKALDNFKRVTDSGLILSKNSRKVTKVDGYQNKTFAGKQNKSQVTLQHDEYWPWRLDDPRIKGKTYWIGNPSNPVTAIFVIVNRNSPRTCEIIDINYSSKTNKKHITEIMNSIIFDLRPGWIMFPYEQSLEGSEYVGWYFNKWASILESSLFGEFFKTSLSIESDLMQYTQRPVGYRIFEDNLSRSHQIPSPKDWELNDEMFN